MERDAFALMAAHERDHWWFRGRRHFIARVFDRLPLSRSARILDAGCGSGGNLSLLSKYGEVWGFEYDAGARTLAEQEARMLGQGPVAPGALPDSVPFAGTQFEAIGLFDVLEHLPQPVASLSALGERLLPGGSLVLTVPALPWLWGPHDEVHQHHRRYTAASLRAHLTEAGFEVEYLSYFNMLLLPLALLQRMRERLFGYTVEALTPAPVVNAAFYRVWRLEQAIIPQGRLPIGLSLLAVARPRR